MVEADLPAETCIVLDFRGTSDVGTGTAAVNANQIDAYGEVLRSDPITYGAGGGEWSSSISSIDGDRYVQTRLTFVNNVQSGLSPLLRSIGLAFSE